MVYCTRFESREQARGAVFRWIEVWYNRKRRHSTLGYISPEAFERKHQQQQAEAMAAPAAFLSKPSRDGSGVLHADAFEVVLVPVVEAAYQRGHFGRG